MGGGLMQIITYGTQDLTLTGNPEITFFNIIYRRYTNFGKKIISLSFDNSPNFNSVSYVNIPKNNGDLLSKVILKIKLPKIDFTYINNTLSDLFNTQKNISAENIFAYYDYFIKFYNKLKNIIKVFFIKYDVNNTSLTYIQDLKNNILNYFNYSQYSQFFLSIDYFFNNIIISTNTVNYNIELYTNASLFKINNNNLIYIYELFSYNILSYEGFKFTVNKNLEILEYVNKLIYNKYKNILQTDQISVCWVNKIGIYLFNSIEFYVGSNKIYSLSDFYINNYGELYYKNKDLYNKLIGNNTEINTFSSFIDETILYLPIPFWDLLNYGLAFPLISLQYNSLQIKINTKNFLDCIRINYNKQNYDENIDAQIINLLVNNLSSVIDSKLDITLLLEYIYLDSIERKKFAVSAHEYLIQQVQEIEFNNLNTTNNNFQLDIFHCCKDMFWFANKIPNASDIFSNNINVYSYIYTRPNIVLSNNIKGFFSYSRLLYLPNTLFDPDIFYNGLYIVYNNTKYTIEFYFIIDYLSNVFYYPTQNKNLNKIISESYFNLNSVQLIGENSSFFNYLQPFIYYNSTPQDGLNVYSFSLKPTEFQPSGCCNMSRISFIGLKLKINNFSSDVLEDLLVDKQSNITPQYRLIFQTTNYNVLRLIGGIGATAYTY